MNTQKSSHEDKKGQVVGKWMEYCKQVGSLPEGTTPEEVMAGFLLSTYGQIHEAITAAYRHRNLNTDFYLRVWGILVALDSEVPGVDADVSDTLLIEN